MRRVFIFFVIFLISSAATVSVNAASLTEGKDLFTAGRYETAAKWYANFVASNSADKKLLPEALVGLGISLEMLSDIINTQAEKECFRSGKSSQGTQCMKAYANKLNTAYGAGSFEYLEQMVIIRYTGSHFKKVVDEFGNSEYAPGAAYKSLTKNLTGHMDVVLPRIKEFLSKYNNGEWHRRGLLLWARINEDIWWIHRKWSWLLYNWQISSEELIVKAEPYRQEALRTFEDIIKKYGNTEEGRAARKERDLLKDYKDDGKIYGIINESVTEGAEGIKK